MSEETHEEKKVVEVEGPTRPRRRRRRNRNPGDGSSEPNTTAQESSDSASASAESVKTVAAPEASASQPAGEDGQKTRSRRRRRKSRSKRQDESVAVEGGQEPAKAAAKAASQPDSKKGDGSQQKGSGRSQGDSNKNRSKQQKPRTRDRDRDRDRSKSQSRANVYKPRTPESKFGGREPLITQDYEEERSNKPLALTPFELFCTYHLGISDDNRYRPTNIREVAKRFAVGQDELEQALKGCGLDRDSLRKINYDMSLAQLDMQVAPEGIDKRELAKVLFSELVEMSPEVERSVAALEQAAAAPAADEQRIED